MHIYVCVCMPPLTFFSDCQKSNNNQVGEVNDHETATRLELWYPFQSYDALINLSVWLKLFRPFVPSTVNDLYNNNLRRMISVK